MSYLELLKLASPETVVVVTALAVLAIGLTKLNSKTICSFMTAAGLAIAAVAVLMLPRHATLFGGMLVISPLNSLFKIICLALAFVTVPVAASEISLRNSGEFLAMLLLGTVGLMLLVGAEELLTIFIGLELLGLSLYVMAAFDKIDIRSAEAGLKYFLFGSTASAFTLFGISLIYGMTGATALASIGQKLAASNFEPLLAVGVVMTLIGFAFKIAAAPFHLWAPDAYQGAPIPSAAFIASASKVASFVVLGKIVFVGFGPFHGSSAWHAMLAGWSPALAALAALSILLGNFVALAQTNVRRLLAYSAVAHGGYTLLGLVAGGRDGFAATLFYTTIYAVTLVGAFAVTGIVRRETGGDDLQNFAGLAARSPLAAACMSIFMLSLAGLPPLAGFFGKFYLFSVAFRADRGLLWLVIVALFGSFVSLYYYLIVLKFVFIESAPEPRSSLASPRFVTNATIAVLAAAVLFFGLLPQTLTARIIATLP
jgi:NADH-quinone oxidoreductase subunit N